jgi:hypothetical protein
MGQVETLIEEAIQHAQSRGIQITGGGAIFDWCCHDNRYDSHWATAPISCNALGAVLLKLGKQNMAKEEFHPDWLPTVCQHLGVDPFWVNRFVLGFDYGTQVYLIVTKDGKDIRIKDDISPIGLKLARKYIAGRK